MRAIVLERVGEPLRLADLPPPKPGEGQVLLRVHACGICRTDAHIAGGDLAAPKLPLILGHQIVGTVVRSRAAAGWPAVGERVGVPWLGWTCGACGYCATDRENLCEAARFTGYDLGGGFAEMVAVDAGFCLPIPDRIDDLAAAPLLCGGLIGYRCLRMAGDAERLGIYGFGSAAHILTQVARHQGRRVFAFTRPGDEAAQRFALDVGAAWAGGSDQASPEPLDAAIIFAAAGELVPAALEAVVPGGTVVCGEIHMTDIPSFPYELLWRERVLRSVANLTRRDGREFLPLAAEVPVRTRVTAVPLERANEALDAIRSGTARGSSVLTVASPDV
jgi:propanol-preferring alcohol dehydrogenase